MIFNNAGINVAATPLEDLDFDKWQSVVAANLTGVFLCAQGAYPDDEGAGPARRPDHQQRLDLGPHAAAECHRL